LGTTRAISQQSRTQRYDFSPAAGAVSVLGLVLAGSQTSFDVNLTPFGSCFSLISLAIPEKSPFFHWPVDWPTTAAALVLLGASLRKNG